MNANPREMWVVSYLRIVSGNFVYEFCVINSSWEFGPLFRTRMHHNAPIHLFPLNSKEITKPDIMRDEDFFFFFFLILLQICRLHINLYSINKTHPRRYSSLTHPRRYSSYSLTGFRKQADDTIRNHKIRSL